MHFSLPSGLTLKGLRGEWEVVYFFFKEQPPWDNMISKKMRVAKKQMNREKEKGAVRRALFWELESPYFSLDLVPNSSAA